MLAAPLLSLAVLGCGDSANGSGAGGAGPACEPEDTAGAAAEGPSCAGGLQCAQGSCCEAPLVPGCFYTFVLTTPSPGTSPWVESTVSVSSFRLDKYEVTVGRFRKFVDAVIAGWQPPPGSGKHTHLAGGGIQESPPEQGWDPTWPALPTDKTVWDSHHWQDPATQMDPGGWTGTWTVDPGDNENLPMEGVTWYEAYAFCIWDGGFLPTDRELEYAYVGGSEQRPVPWGAEATTCEFAQVEFCDKLEAIDVGSKPLGNGKWGHADLAGNLSEWVLDRGSYEIPDIGNCTLDCATLAEYDAKVSRGSNFHSSSLAVDATPGGGRGAGRPDVSGAEQGVRCARAP